jgi:penicillin-binding protein 1B
VAIKLKIPQNKKRRSKSGGFLGRDPIIRIALIIFAVLAIAITSVFSYYYVKYDRIIQHRFEGKIFSNSAKIYAIPKAIRVGQKVSATEVAAELRQAGYTDRLLITARKRRRSKSGAGWCKASPETPAI